MRNDRLTVDLSSDNERLHALVMDAWRGEAARAATDSPLHGGCDLGERIARVARIAAARHMALRVHGDWRKA